MEQEGSELGVLSGLHWIYRILSAGKGKGKGKGTSKDWGFLFGLISSSIIYFFLFSFFFFLVVMTEWWDIRQQEGCSKNNVEILYLIYTH